MDNNTPWNITILQFQVHSFENFISNLKNIFIKMAFQSFGKVTHSLGEALKLVVITRAKFK
jgi:hypothetical protein